MPLVPTPGRPAGAARRAATGAAQSSGSEPGRPRHPTRGRPRVRSFNHRSGGPSMFRAREGREKRKGSAAITIEPLEDRVVLTAAVAQLEIQYLRTINHLNG